MGDSEPPGILCESCACIIHTNLQSCMSIYDLIFFIEPLGQHDIFSLFLVLAAMGNQFRILQLVCTESKGVPATRWKNTVAPSGIVTGSTGSPLVLPGPIFRLLDLLLDTGVHPSSPSSLNFTPATNTPRSIFLSHLKRASQIPSYQLLGIPEDQGTGVSV